MSSPDLRTRSHLLYPRTANEITKLLGLALHGYTSGWFQSKCVGWVTLTHGEGWSGIDNLADNQSWLGGSPHQVRGDRSNVDIRVRATVEQGGKA